MEAHTWWGGVSPNGAYVNRSTAEQRWWSKRTPVTFLPVTLAWRTVAYLAAVASASLILPLVSPTAEAHPFLLGAALGSAALVGTLLSETTASRPGSEHSETRPVPTAVAESESWQRMVATAHYRGPNKVILDALWDAAGLQTTDGPAPTLTAHAQAQLHNLARKVEECGR